MNKLVALVLLSGCVRHFQIDTVYRVKKEEGVYRVLQDQYGNCAVSFRARLMREWPLTEYPIDKDFYNSLDDEWCESATEQQIAL
ncbi:hypothetical protein CL616_02460 [archaeon]|nr:hypothetical protein [archaeon]|tara:strand:+ start:94 stop:348 length:255 start_codon:yes stop_codon:yes gene_type:complete